MKKLFIEQRLFSLGGHFTVMDEQGQDQYIVKGKFTTIPRFFTITDSHGRRIGSISQKAFSFLPKFFVNIEEEQVMRIEKQLAFFKSHYRINVKNLDIQGDWWNKNFEIRRGKELVATIQEKWFTMGTFFEITIYDEALEHTTIALVIAIDVVKESTRRSTINAR